MADFNKKLSELHQRVVRDTLGMPASIDEYGWIQFRHPGLGELTITLREYNPEYMNLQCMFEDHTTRAREDLLQICSSVNEGSEIAQLSVSSTGSHVWASVRLLLAADGKMPDESLLREVIRPAMSSIKAVAAQLADELPKLEAARKAVNDHLSLAYRPGITADALFQIYTSSPAFAEDRRTSEEMGDFFHPYGHARKRCNEMCAPGAHTGVSG